MREDSSQTLCPFIRNHITVQTGKKKQGDGEGSEIMWAYSMNHYVVHVCVSRINTLNSAVWADPSAWLPVSLPPGLLYNSVTDCKPERVSTWFNTLF